MSADSSDTADAVTQFMIAYQAYFWPASNQRQLDNPTFRPTLIKVLEDYTAPWRKGCVPPDAVHWRSPDNNKAFLEQRIVMTTNGTLSIPAALRIGQPDDYYQNTATISWPSAPDGRILPLLSIGVQLVIFSKARDLASAKEFVRFLLREERLGAWFEGARGRWLPTLVELAGSPFWTDPSDPHRLPAVEQLANPSIPVWGPVRASLPSWWDDVGRQLLLGGAVHRIAADGLTPEQAVDELIAKLRQFQSK
jgi:multiple sugar transport system substrate-binding protein